MQLKYKKKINSKDSHIIIAIFEDKEPKKLPSSVKKTLSLYQKNKDFTGKHSKLLIINTDAKTKEWAARTIFIGLGKSKELTGKKVREAFAVAAKKARKLESAKINIQLSSVLKSYAQEIGEACQLANYSLGGYKTDKESQIEKKKQFNSMIYVSEKRDKDFEKGLQRGILIASSVNLVRDLVNGPSNIVDEGCFAKKAKEVAKNSRCKVRILEKKDLERLKMGALLGVNHGCAAGAKLITLEYKPSRIKSSPIILVGKGVLFDTGGYNLKPTSGIDTMHMDMAGAAVVLGIMNLLRSLEIKQHVIGVMPITQNMIDANAQRPNDIVTSYSGKTIQILNTDAEGRLILADALSYAQEKWKKPRAIIDIATLTGACMVALGEQYAGLMGNDQELIDGIKNSGEKTDEELWQLPIHKKFIEIMKDDMADLRNIDRGTSRLAGASKAAGFLQHFIEKGNKWAHIDIAGTAFVKDPKKYDQKYGTGYGVRLMIDYLENLSK